MKQENKTNLTDNQTFENEPEELGEGVSTENDAPNSNSKQPPNVEKTKGRWWLPYAITFAVLAIFTILVGWAQGGFSETNEKLLLAHWGDAFGIPGLLAICFGLLVVASNGGTFDMLAYGLRRFFGLFKKSPLDRKYDNFYEYRKHRQEQKRSFWYMIAVGGAYLLVGIILLIFYMQI